ncbi:bifunctional 2-polyprenyl-6-hydroxyphenol methylase/3-demethylubiquinol 3-O-methyltransferase UbiG [Allofrancisella guangzhouensis]|uniref:Ubiquinone biosynthesis O-methyltransferase n=1 Tax=Allofrancisella guangzhouensis TaxID=594679 RepID=A0A0A8E2N2_9GAMM|nr:bifunctional 2-polyprenyl-6-hydroxyphenol methylase/3-demethylubiquinol 3-O-methyltransferase UbiG [Allofrancisella guangzhouensis]AJC48204.1 3-demethylubiquinone-9 3-methyltransferase [Allofrancisella guangzhouensis]MBK2027071.1 bifunctional 2-polyprenyl-6-hydroxyphenol methylase/3-demethylubiquinol 3-O-methyltransferase UbiG [Allofrancisella guangzhouensis]MBK2044561.1 bifunctional 2-polyprenyl-6-hydroxyphenol methylase/3-demethylubiquinol 3-O-methyltransferase UbiG [Allofrancisella guangzh
MNNLDNNEVDKFSRLANGWWNPNGKLKTLHQVNPVRLEFIKQYSTLCNKKIIDIGCGGGILTESLVTTNNKVYGLDASIEAINIAKEHAKSSKVNISYTNSTIEEFVKTTDDQFDIITCMEMLEHVPDPESVIVSISKLTKQGGLFFASTLNRNLKSYLLSIVAAEYILKMVPKGTHQYSKFIKPYELTKVAEKYGFKPLEITGIHYNPITDSFKSGKNADVNYIVAFEKV